MGGTGGLGNGSKQTIFVPVEKRQVFVDPKHILPEI